MNASPLQRQIVASDIAPEQLAGNSRLSGEQKIGEASRQFEAILLRQILSASQKTVIKSEFSDNSTAAGIYQDLITNTLADNISKSRAFGLAKTFEQQLNHHTPTSSQAGNRTAPAAGAGSARPEINVTNGSQSAPLNHHPVSFSKPHP